MSGAGGKGDDDETLVGPGVHQPVYLGDGVYATFDGYYIWLEARGADHDNRIALGPDEFQALLEYRHKLFDRLPKERA